MDMKEKILNEIEAVIKSRSVSFWRKPLAGFADADSPYIRNLRRIVHPLHRMPREALEDASVVIVYFLPFKEDIPRGNTRGELSSREWAEVYEETNALFPVINSRLTALISSLGYEAAVPPEASVFYRDEIISRWSFRHLAYAAGLGTFGLNNMLITREGCAGRLNGIVSNIPLETGRPLEEEACLYKRNGSCGVCVKRCPSGALSSHGFNRRLCYDQCLKNAAVYTSLGSSYASAPGEEAADTGSGVCGKCLCGCPCTFKRPL